MARSIDREKIIKGLEHCTAMHGLYECQPKDGEDCPYVDESDCKFSIMQDVLTLLKEQEPVTPTKNDFEIPLTSYYSFECECTAPLMKDQPYCMKCGRAVKW